MSRRAKKVDGDEFNVDRQLENTLQQSAAAATMSNNDHGNRYYGNSNRPVVTGPSKRKSYPQGEGDNTHSHSAYRRGVKGDRFSVDIVNSYPPQSSQKRVRSNDWSIQGDGEQVANGITHRELPEKPTLRSRRGQDVTELKESQERQSRFLEGSMNDRVSTQPPSTFIGDEQEYLLSRYMDENNDLRGGRRVDGWQSTGHIPMTPTLHGKKASLSSINTADTDAADPKHSSVFRFGKAIVSAFNPMGVWGNVSEIWKGHDSSSKGSTSREALEDTPQAARIAKAYEEYKASSAYKRNTPMTAPLYRYGHSRENTASPTKFTPAQTPQLQSHRPSASIQSSTSKELPPTPLEWQAQPPSSTKRSSFQTIKNSRSFLNLGQSLRKEQSQKDLAKENKLRKKVSNLEEKLLKYKRELSVFGHEGEGIGEEPERETLATGPQAASTAPAPPAHDMRYMRMRMKKFVPGALPSLPSERLLFDGEEPGTIREVSEQESSPEKPLYTRKSEPRLRRTVPRIGKEGAPNTPSATITNRTMDGNTPPSRKRKSPSPDPASIRRRRISATYSKELGSIDASPPTSPPPTGRHSTELNGPRPRPRNARAETETRRNQPSRKAKEIKPNYCLFNYESIDHPAPAPESGRSDSRPRNTQTPGPAPAPAKAPIPTPTPSHSDSSVSVEVAVSTLVPPPIPSSTKPPPASKPKPTQKQNADANANAITAPIPPPRPASVPTADMISRSGSPKKHNISPRRRANNKPITVTPGSDGNENIPPVPPLPAEHAGSAAKREPFEWPEDCF